MTILTKRFNKDTNYRVVRHRCHTYPIPPSPLSAPYLGLCDTIAIPLITVGFNSRVVRHQKHTPHYCQLPILGCATPSTYPHQSQLPIGLQWGYHFDRFDPIHLTKLNCSLAELRTRQPFSVAPTHQIKRFLLPLKMLSCCNYQCPKRQTFWLSTAGIC